MELEHMCFIALFNWGPDPMRLTDTKKFSLRREISFFFRVIAFTRFFFFGTPHQGDRIRTYGPLYPKQMRWPDCATPRLTPPGAYRSTRSMNTWTELAHPFGHRDARTNPRFQPLFLENVTPALYGFLASSFTWIFKSGSLPVTCPLDPSPV